MTVQHCSNIKFAYSRILIELLAPHMRHYDNGWQKKRTLPNGSYTDYEWNGLGLPKTLTNKKSDGTVRSAYDTFGYDGVFNMTGMTTSDHVQTLFEGDNDWAYDNTAGKDRLTSEVYDQTAGNTIDYTSSFGYDAADNPTTFKGTSQSFNAANQRSATGYVFDGNGNPTTYAGGTLTFSVENRLTSIVNGTNNYWAGYRADGLRAYKNGYVGTSPGSEPTNTRTYFYYDRGMPVLETDASGNVTSVNVFADDGLVARKVGSVYRYYQFDPQGSVTHRLTSTETVSGSAKYDAYGKFISIPGTVTDVFGWNGRWGYLSESETGLILCMHRYYDADQGRWLNRDPIGYEGGVNLYGYCQSSPNQHWDPVGLRGMGDSLALGLANLISKLPPWAQNIIYGSGLTSREWVARIQMRLGSPEGMKCTQTVGRYMSKAEYDLMQSSGHVQASISGGPGRQISNVIVNLETGSYAGAPSNTRLVIFDTHAGHIIKGGRGDWGNIIGGGDSTFGSLVGPFSGMPPAINIGPWGK